MEQKKHITTNKVVSLFVATALIVAPGCSSKQANTDCVDANQDGYCDNSGSGSSSSSYRYYGGGSSISNAKPSSGSFDSSGISRGSAPHGGIGSGSKSSSS
ncbi:hypothetical protein [Paenibacillus xerothermodurans]|uniref:Uncharacterized protein n=1 Tax=Paenibacillus xerothermodurans TaxID=1977292 RepID=A0A2W1NEX7_PAEXE|nr:hypothetical protein [Paenibacillus xerothermodurans]PZE22504.1 hypothetical protein CBW46_001585 [Paenibacillus xerothermodurans]